MHMYMYIQGVILNSTCVHVYYPFEFCLQIDNFSFVLR